jgi:hypothetical protein
LDEAHDPVRKLEHEHKVTKAQDAGEAPPPRPDEPYSGGRGDLPGS